jgi:TPR repeat protein
MDQPFFRRLFSRSAKPSVEATETQEIQAELGNAEAQFYLGVKYANSEGPAQDYGRAAKWYQKAAEQDHVLAQFNLGVMYANGQGVSRNPTEADVWFGKAAQRGDAGAQHSLGMSRYRASISGPTQDMPEARIEAYTWFILAAAQGYGDSDVASATVALNMTHDDVTEATRRVARFEPSVRTKPLSQ